MLVKVGAQTWVFLAFPCHYTRDRGAGEGLGRGSK
jgi:hypothetical protein